MKTRFLGLAYLPLLVCIGCESSDDSDPAASDTTMTDGPGSSTEATTNGGTTGSDPGSTTTASATGGGQVTGDSATSTAGAESSSTVGGSGGGPPAECPYTPVEGTPSVALELVAGGFRSPTLAIGDPVQRDRLYVLEQRGTIKQIDPGVTTAPSEDWFSVDTPAIFEGGLLGMAFHPDYANNGLVYLAYTAESNDDDPVIVTEFRVEDGAIVDGSARDVIGIGQPQGNHNGGMIEFGPDGMLYIASGDGGVQNDGCGYGQNGGVLLGKILRIDPAADGQPDAPAPCANNCGCSVPGSFQFDYTIPADNPFVGDGSVRDEIYATGLRNPWRFSFDPADGRMFVADVGQSGREEIDIVEAGANLGWGNMEGFSCFSQSGCDVVAPGQVNADGLTMPIVDYASSGGRCSVTGLGVYRSCEVPAWQGLYFYADLCSGEVFAVDWADGEVTDLGPLVDIPAGDGAFGGGYNAYGDVFITTDNYLGSSSNPAVYRIAPQ